MSANHVLEAIIAFLVAIAVFSGIYYIANSFNVGSVTYTAVKEVDELLASTTDGRIEDGEVTPPAPSWPKQLDTEAYNARLLDLAGYTPPSPVVITIPATGTHPTTTKHVMPPSPLRYSSTTNVTIEGELYPAPAPYPYGGALLPFNRIVAYYGNFYSKNMGVLGEYSEAVMLDMFREQIAKWEQADPETPVVPAIDYIAVTAQASAGPDGNYNLRMPDDQIDYALALADKMNGIVILEVQVGLADLMSEVKMLEKYLKMPQVHLAIDPEFHMRRDHLPGQWIGTVTAGDINKAIAYLSSLVEEHQLPPKVLIVHRFTQMMVQNAEDIQPTEAVQVVIDMDGWGTKARKKGTYNHIVAPEPVQFTGFKVFYENDLKPPSTGLMMPEDILELYPKPIFIQYQ